MLLKRMQELQPENLHAVNNMREFLVYLISLPFFIVYALIALVLLTVGLFALAVGGICAIIHIILLAMLNTVMEKK